MLATSLSDNRGICSYSQSNIAIESIHSKIRRKGKAMAVLDPIWIPTLLKPRIRFKRYVGPIRIIRIFRSSIQMILNKDQRDGIKALLSGIRLACLKGTSFVGEMAFMVFSQNNLKIYLLALHIGRLNLRW